LAMEVCFPLIRFDIISRTKPKHNLQQFFVPIDRVLRSSSPPEGWSVDGRRWDAASTVRKLRQKSSFCLPPGWPASVRWSSSRNRHGIASMRNCLFKFCPISLTKSFLRLSCRSSVHYLYLKHNRDGVH
jgi:hypothetical protein